ncbi:metallophosphoesterase [Massilia sp. DJPM01]|uniref:metallophosphoesterase n=1 Tax=Massilia sp. DJPM01 TaxID=3024404 RepID=UPI00259F8934|nr:metallophosphoesterase [Massilia sp. DJPM01]MDM5176114.1 metallophosphoesterase [Massilia sp. DJPM01]
MKKYLYSIVFIFFATIPGTAAAQTFTLAFIGDTQFDWGCESEHTELSDYCKISANRAKPEQDQAAETNGRVVARVNELKNAEDTNLKGLVINGDLTRFGSKDHYLGKFQDMYMNQTSFPVWPGLGNHDYQNNINACGAPATMNWNYCGADMMQFLASWLNDNRSKTVSYDLTNYSKNSSQMGWQRNISGSLAYSWEIGSFHFVQLNNYPTYKTKFKHGYSFGVYSWDLDATSPADWIAHDFSTAVENRKVIILNWHDFDDAYGNNYDAPEYKEMIAMLDKYASNIKAVFVGHRHEKIGHNGTTDFIKFKQSSNHAKDIWVPVIHSGSPIWGRFMRADFSDPYYNCKITISEIDIADLSNSGKNPKTIDCSVAKDSSTANRLAFGGAYGFIHDGSPVINPVTNAQSCPSGYLKTQVYGTSGVDWPVYICSKQQPEGASSSEYDFGGMWGYINDGELVRNPLSGDGSCSPGFIDVKLLDTYNQDWSLHACYRKHDPDYQEPLYFGGVLGTVNGTPVKNPMTGNFSCPEGFSRSRVLGTYNQDYDLSYCYAIPKL